MQNKKFLKKRQIYFLGIIMFSTIFLYYFNKIGYFSSYKVLKGGVCIKNYCEGDFGCLPIGSCSLDETTGICIEDPIGGCHEEHPPISTRKCTFRLGSSLICEEGDIEVLVRMCKDYCYWVPFLLCQCRSRKIDKGWIGKLHDCWYR